MYRFKKYLSTPFQVLLVFYIYITPASLLFAKEQIASPEVKSKIEKIIGKPGNKINYFKGPEGMVGIAVTLKSGRQIALYATESGEHLFSGAVIQTSTGINLAQSDTKKYAPAIDWSPLINALENDSHKFIQGNANSKDKVFVFIDPNCPHCHKTFKNMQKILKDNPNLSVSWVPVGILSPKSENLAKAMLGEDPEAAFNALNITMNRGQYIPLSSTVIAGEKKHQENKAIYSSYGFSGVPVVVLNIKDKVKVMTGAPSLEQLSLLVRPNEASIDKKVSKN